MTTKKLITLAAAAAVLGGLAVVSSNSKKLKTPSLTGKPVLKTLDLSEILRIEVSDNGEKTLALESTGEGWVMKSLYDYPADIVKIRENLLALSDLKIGQVATGKKLDHALVVDLQGASGKSLATLRLGEKYMREATGQMAMYGGGAYPSGRYVATEGDTVYLVTETLDAFDGDPKSWTETQIASVPRTGIVTAEYTVDGETLKMENKDGVWTLEGLGENEELDTFKLHSVNSTLGNINFNTIADPALTEEQTGMTTGVVFKVTLASGEAYTAKIGAAAGADRYFNLSASFTPTGTDEAADAQATERINAFNAKSGKWTYLIPAYSADNMTKRRADVVKAKEEEPVSSE
ncbi:MAG: DUF4340 domain-containing protein [Kiritimatiellaeota bacterium]|nr:DUF4340 domain-containing protein [Kiritimatiellota bacterium]